METFPRYWPFVQWIHRSRWIPRTKASDAELRCFSLICASINGWVNSPKACDLRRHRAHYDVTWMILLMTLGNIDVWLTLVQCDTMVWCVYLWLIRLNDYVCFVIDVFSRYLVTGEFPSRRPVTRGLMLSLICTWISGWVNNRKSGDLRVHRAHYDVSVIWMSNYIPHKFTGVINYPVSCCGHGYKWHRFAST